MTIPAYTSLRIEGSPGTRYVALNDFVDTLNARSILVARMGMDVGLSERDIHLLQGAYAEIQAMLKAFERETV